MITLESIMSISKSDLREASKTLKIEDIPQLIEWLNIKDDNIRYQVFLLLQNRSLFYDDVYPHWDIFREKLKNDNSYQRSIGLILIAENVKWDMENRIGDTIDECLVSLSDEKPMTIRQCIQALGKIASARPGLTDKIASSLINFDLMAIRETIRKSILLDIMNVLLIIRKKHKTDEIETFILNALSGEVLDKKSKQQAEVIL